MTCELCKNSTATICNNCGEKYLKQQREKVLKVLGELDKNLSKLNETLKQIVDK